MEQQSKIEKKTLSNGLTIIHKKVPAETVTVEFSVHTGSIMETKQEAGLSHFLEHLLFEGTKKRPTSKAIANEIEKYGGEFNAATSQERTYYYVKIAKKHFPIALDILQDMFTNSLFDKKIIEKERKVVLDEINMINDNPRHYQWILFNKALFGKHAAALPVYGNVPVLKKITREQIMKYFAKWYIPSQITVIIVGDIPDGTAAVEAVCGNWNKKEIEIPVIAKPSPNVSTKTKEAKKLGQSYLVLGYKAPLRAEKDAATIDVISGILGRGQSGWLFDEIRAKRGLCYSVGIEYDANKTISSIGIHCGTNKKNLKKVQELILEQLERLKEVNQEEVEEAKTFIDGSLALRRENTAAVAEELAYWHHTASLEKYEKYLDEVKKVTATDVQNFAKAWFTDQYTIAILEQKK
ncbi:insulinase family protein [Candidatus Woesearchaeota archaeon]|nr:insulinase family protein [Candidatus Woesearchaeota archaeon]